MLLRPRQTTQTTLGGLAKNVRSGYRQWPWPEATASAIRRPSEGTTGVGSSMRYGHIGCSLAEVDLGDLGRDRGEAHERKHEEPVAEAQRHGAEERIEERHVDR